MILSKSKIEYIKNYFLIKYGLEIKDVEKFKDMILLKPYGMLCDYGDIVLERYISLDEHTTNISQLSGLTELHSLFARGIYTDGSVISEFVNLKELQVGKKVSDISFVKGLSKLNYLNLSWNKGIIDYSPISNLTNLEILILTGCENLSFDFLEPLKSLTYLNISHTNWVPGTSLSPLFGLKNLIEINLSLTPAKNMEVKKLKEALPECLITFF